MAIRAGRTGLISVFVIFVSAAVAARAYDPPSGDFSKRNAADIRLLTYNTHQVFIADPSKDAAFNRVLVAISPDIICFEEIITSVSTAQIATRLNTILPNPPNGWVTFAGLSDGFQRNVLASRWPLLMARTDTIPASSTRGLTLALVDLPNATYQKDIYLLGAHLKCCTSSGNEDVSRQRSADAFASWVGDARQAGGNISLPANTPMIGLGDFNLVGGPQPGQTIVTGNIIDNAAFGPDVKGDWDVTDLTDLAPTNPLNGTINTWPSTTVAPTSRLDRFFISDSVTTVATSFVFNTLSMNAAQLAVAGVQANDTTTNSTSDHLPIVMDVRFAVACACRGDVNQDGLVNGDDVQTFVGQLLAGANPLLSVQACASDLNRDGVLTSADADRLVTAILNGTCDPGP